MRIERQGARPDQELRGALPGRPSDHPSRRLPADVRPGISKGLATLIFGTVYGFVVASLVWGVWFWLSDGACSPPEGVL